MRLSKSSLVFFFQDRFLRDDEEYRLRLFSVLAPYAHKVEQVHATLWNDVTANLPSLSSKLAFRSKMDLFLFRIHTQLDSVRALKNAGDHRAVQALCALLKDYVRLCYTRVVVPSVIDTCLDAVLAIAHRLFDNHADMINAGPDALRSIMSVMELLDELSLRSSMPATTELLVAITIESEPFWLFMRHFSGEVFLNPKVLIPSFVVVEEPRTDSHVPRRSTLRSRTSLASDVSLSKSCVFAS